MTDKTESLKAAIAEVDAANPADAVAPVPEAEGKQDAPPAEQGNEAEADATSDDSGDSAASDGSDAPAQRQNKGVGKRINELTREKYEERRAREAAERELAELKAQFKQSSPTQPAQANPDGKPLIEDYGYDFAAHAEAVAEWKYKAMREQEQSQAAQRATADAFQERIKQVDPDEWQEAIKAPVNYTDAMLEVIRESDMGPKVAVYLARNLDEADQISRMSDFHAAAALGRIEAKLSVPAPVPAPTPPKSVTRAPAPAPTVQGTSAVKKDAHEKSVEDFVADIRAKSHR